MIAVLELGGVVMAQIFINGVTIRNDTMVTSIPTALQLVFLDAAEAADYLVIAEFAVYLIISNVAVHLILLGVVDGTVLADKGLFHLRFMPIIAELELGDVVMAQIINNCVTIRNDTLVTSIPS